MGDIFMVTDVNYFLSKDEHPGSVQDCLPHLTHIRKTFKELRQLQLLLEKKLSLCNEMISDLNDMKTVLQQRLNRTPLMGSSFEAGELYQPHKTLMIPSYPRMESVRIVRCSCHRGALPLIMKQDSEMPKLQELDTVQLLRALAGKTLLLLTKSKCKLQKIQNSPLGSEPVPRRVAKHPSDEAILPPTTQQNGDWFNWRDLTLLRLLRGFIDRISVLLEQRRHVPPGYIWVSWTCVRIVLNFSVECLFAVGTADMSGQLLEMRETSGSPGSEGACCCCHCLCSSNMWP